ncbi:MAG TPA: hypothetical protein DCK95_05620 [Anaerolineaceae bacterium]|nr:hypothetical protein [Anaerolineaceae bacterium]
MEIKPAPIFFQDLPQFLDTLILKKDMSTEDFVKIIAVGDIGFSGRIQTKIKNNNTDSRIFDEVLPFLVSGDLVFGNLETPLIEDSTTKMFASDPENANLLAMCGFNILHVANNHILDYGEEGLRKTIQHLNINNILPLGAGQTIKEVKKLRIIEINGLKIGWIGCGRTHVKQNFSSVGYWEYEEAELIQAIRKSKAKVDTLIISIHAGQMYLDYPKPEIKETMEKLLESGANLILLHHAHVLQGVQVYRNNNICCFNLGNFLLDIKEGNVEIPILAKEQTESAVFVFNVNKSGIHSAFALPTYFDEDFNVHWAVGQRGRLILERLIRISEDIKYDYRDLYHQQRAERNAMPIIKVMGFHIKNGNWKFVFSQLTHLRFEHVRMLISYVYTKFFGA